MNKKLTLTIEQKIIERAKKYARQKGMSLSGMVENYLKVIAKEQVRSNVEIMPLVKSLRGAFRAPSDFDYRKKLTESLTDKYLSNESGSN